jgi:exportin-1
MCFNGLCVTHPACRVCSVAVLQEVIVVEDENGNIVRETMKDNDVLMQYRTMRETLIYLSHLDYEDTELQMLEKLRGQMSGTWTWNGLNTLCWAIGSISGSMHVSGGRGIEGTCVGDEAARALGLMSC